MRKYEKAGDHGRCRASDDDALARELRAEREVERGVHRVQPVHLQLRAPAGAAECGAVPRLADDNLCGCNPGRYAVYSVFSLYVALILYMAIKRNSERAIQGVWMWIGYIFLISALIAFVLMVIIPIFTKTGEFFSLGSQSQAAPVAAPPPPPQ